MQDYSEFMRELRSAIAGIGQVITGPEADKRLTAAQIRHRRGKNFATSDLIAYRNMAGSKLGPVIVEISQGVMFESRVIGVTVWHQIAANAAHDFDESGCFHSIGDAVARLRELDGQESDNA